MTYMQYIYDSRETFVRVSRDSRKTFVRVLHGGRETFVRVSHDSRANVPLFYIFAFKLQDDLFMWQFVRNIFI